MGHKHLFRGKPIGDTEAELEYCLSQLGWQIEQDMAEGALESLPSQVVIDGVGRLVSSGKAAEILTSAPAFAVRAAQLYLSPEALSLKVERELGRYYGSWQPVDEQIEERQQALGILLHIGAGNAVALSALSVLESLLCGNINVLKLPTYEGGLSLKLLEALVEVEPKLAPYIYVFDIGSKDTTSIERLGQVCDAAVVWGSDVAIEAIRQLAPATLPLIEWGHRISFAYLTEKANLEIALGQLASEIFTTNQLFCNSPQCVFVQTEDRAVVEHCSKLLFEAMQAQQTNLVGSDYLSESLDIHVQSEITWVKEMVRMTAVMGDQVLLEDPSHDFSVMIDWEAALRPSPLYRNIWMMPITESQILPVFRPHKGHLQTVGLACGVAEYGRLSELLLRGGVNRIRPMGDMMGTYVGEPHDGKVSLMQYTRRVSRCVV